ncbi:hypothetical protein QJQ45_024470, partial [Haematococcus lacustris]
EDQQLAVLPLPLAATTHLHNQPPAPRPLPSAPTPSPGPCCPPSSSPPPLGPAAGDPPYTLPPGPLTASSPALRSPFASAAPPCPASGVQDPQQQAAAPPAGGRVAGLWRGVTARVVAAEVRKDPERVGVFGSRGEIVVYCISCRLLESPGWGAGVGEEAAGLGGGWWCVGWVQSENMKQGVRPLPRQQRGSLPSRNSHSRNDSLGGSSASSVSTAAQGRGSAASHTRDRQAGGGGESFTPWTLLSQVGTGSGAGSRPGKGADQGSDASVDDARRTSTWTVAHRYSDFERLHLALLRHPIHGHTYRGARAVLPPKRLSLMAHDPQFIERRRAELDAYLVSLMSHPLLAASSELRNFLGLYRPATQPLPSRNPSPPRHPSPSLLPPFSLPAHTSIPGPLNSTQTTSEENQQGSATLDPAAPTERLVCPSLQPPPAPPPSSPSMAHLPPHASLQASTSCRPADSVDAVTLTPCPAAGRPPHSLVGAGGEEGEEEEWPSRLRTFLHRMGLGGGGQEATSGQVRQRSHSTSGTAVTPLPLLPTPCPVEVVPGGGNPGDGEPGVQGVGPGAGGAAALAAQPAWEPLGGEQQDAVRGVTLGSRGGGTGHSSGLIGGGGAGGGVGRPGSVALAAVVSSTLQGAGGRCQDLVQGLGGQAWAGRQQAGRGQRAGGGDGRGQVQEQQGGGRQGQGVRPGLAGKPPALGAASCHTLRDAPTPAAVSPPALSPHTPPHPPAWVHPPHPCRAQRPNPLTRPTQSPTPSRAQSPSPPRNTPSPVPPRRPWPGPRAARGVSIPPAPPQAAPVSGSSQGCRGPAPSGGCTLLPGLSGPVPLSAPLLELLDALCYLSSSGFLGRQAMAVARQLLAMVAGDALDATIAARLHSATSEQAVAQALLALQRKLWPGGRWFATAQTEALDTVAAVVVVAGAAAASALSQDPTRAAAEAGGGRQASAQPEAHSAADDVKAVEGLQHLLLGLLRPGVPLLGLLGGGAFQRGVLTLCELLSSATMTLQVEGEQEGQGEGEGQGVQVENELLTTEAQLQHACEEVLEAALLDLGEKHKHLQAEHRQQRLENESLEAVVKQQELAVTAAKRAQHRLEAQLRKCKRRPQFTRNPLEPSDFFIPTQEASPGKPAARTATFTAQHYLCTAKLMLKTQVSLRRLPTCRRLFITEQCVVANTHRPGEHTTMGRQQRVVCKYIRQRTLDQLRRAKAIHVHFFDGCTCKKHGKVLVIRVTAAVLKDASPVTGSTSKPARDAAGGAAGQHQHLTAQITDVLAIVPLPCATSQAHVKNTAIRAQPCYSHGLHNTLLAGWTALGAGIKAAIEDIASLLAQHW